MATRKPENRVKRIASLVAQVGANAAKLAGTLIAGSYATETDLDELERMACGMNESLESAYNVLRKE